MKKVILVGVLLSLSIFLYSCNVDFNPKQSSVDTVSATSALNGFIPLDQSYIGVWRTTSGAERMLKIREISGDWITFDYAFNDVISSGTTMTNSGTIMMAKYELTSDNKYMYINRDFHDNFGYTLEFNGNSITLILYKDSSLQEARGTYYLAKSEF
ncbi:MAG: hypothetical protein LBS74_01730 [Oscillospiraceae bacterium]|nr:hypothetical protein [Oscillospiraceae bacterium]